MSLPSWFSPPWFRNIQCGLCLRRFFVRTPHRCNHGFRKRRIPWVLLIALLLSCRPLVTVQVPATKTTTVETRRSCWIPELPQPPALIELQYDDDDIMRRTSVHYLTGNEIIQFEQHLYEWAKEVRECLLAE